MPRFVEYALVVIIIVLCAARFLGLEHSPPGFYLDEAGAAVNIICLREDGTGPNGGVPVFFARGFGGGLYTPGFLYFGAAWVELFGYSIASFRSISVFFSVLTILGLYFVARRFAGHHAGLFVAFAAAISPWGYHLTRMAYDPPLAPFFLIWGLYFFLSSTRITSMAISGILFSFAMYSYPPFRAVAPMLFVGLVLFALANNNLRRLPLIVFCCLCVFTSIPLISETFGGDLQDRFEHIGIVSDEFLRANAEVKSLSTLTRIYLENLHTHFKPGFLFFSGDANLRHASQFTGMLSWLDTLAVVLLLALALRLIPQKADPSRFFREKGVPELLAWGVIAGFTPAALTWEGLPHSLRAIGAWPFFSLITGFTLWRVTLQWRHMALPFLLFGLLFASLYAWDFFKEFPRRAYDWYDGAVLDWAQACHARNDWSSAHAFPSRYDSLALRYYLIQYGGMNCTSSYEFFENEPSSD